MERGTQLSGKTVAILVGNGFMESHMTDTQKSLLAQGAETVLVSHEVGLVNGWHEGTWGHNFFIETRPADVLPSKIDGLLIPGGERTARSLLDNAHVRRIVKGMQDFGKPVGLLDESVAVLLATETAEGRRMTGPQELRENIEAGGATYVDEDVVVDTGMITARDAGLAQFVEIFVNAVGGIEATEEAEEIQQDQAA